MIKTQGVSLFPFELPQTIAKPILKWAGGKTQLIDQIAQRLPTRLLDGRVNRYAEPMLGGGAVFFYLAQRFTQLTEFYLSDVNEELVLLYQTVRQAAQQLADALEEMQASYLAMSPQARKDFYYQVRFDYNAKRATMQYQHLDSNWITRAAQMVFLNRTCFNGLYRVNSRGEFNVPFGEYANPRICDRPNLMAVSSVLSRANIHHADFDQSERFIDGSTFVYLDPPYRPLSKTASFTSYVKSDFTDKDQTRLARFFRQQSEKGAMLMLSNSNPKNLDPTDDFFDQLYEGFTLSTVNATRLINSKAAGRGVITELLITNY